MPDHRLLGCCLLAGLAGQAALAQDFSGSEITTVPVAAGIWMLSGPGGNIGVSVGDDGVLIIDNQFAPMTPKIQEAIAKLSPAPVSLVINTHWHADHTGGNANMAADGAIIIAHDKVRTRLSSGQFSAFFRSEVPPAPAEALPVITFDSSLSVHINGEHIRALHFPAAHTDGDAVIWFERSKVIHMGDLFFNGTYPFIDVEAGGSARGVIAAVDAVLELIDGDTRVIPGHGPLSDIDGLAAFRNMLATVVARIDGLHHEGLDVDQIVAARPAADFDEQWGGGFIPADQWVRLVHRSMRL